MKKDIASLLAELLPGSYYDQSEFTEVTPADITTFAEEVKAYFAGLLGETIVRANWQLPNDYAQFLGLGQRLMQGEHGIDEDIFAINHVSDATTNPWYSWNMDELKQRAENKKLQRFDTIWLNMGRWGNKHEYFICCDKLHKNYGEVFDCHDCTPWSGDEAYITDSFDSFTDFLTEKLGKEEEGW